MTDQIIVKDTRAAVYAVLKNDSVLTSEVTGVFVGQAPSNQVVPYVSLGGDSYIPWDSFQNIGFEVTLVVDVWAALNGGDSYASIIAGIYRLLHHPISKLPLTQYVSVDIECELVNVVDDQINNERHGIIRTKSIAQTH